MPYQNVPDHLTDEMHSCVEQVMADGKSKEQAIAICYSRIVEASQPARNREGAMVACFVPASIATALYVIDGLPPQDLHLTLVYLGDADNFDSPGKRAQIESVIGAWAQGQRPLVGEIGGEIRFPDQGDGSPYCAHFDCPALPAARQELVEMLDEFAHIARDGRHGYTPHITLGYEQDGHTFAARYEEGAIPCTFGQVSVVWGDGKQVIFPLGNGPLRQVERLEATINLDRPKTGREWEVTIIGANDDQSNVRTISGEQYIVSENGLPYLVSGIRESVDFWDGMEVCDNHLTDDEFMARGGMRSPTREWVGTIVNPWWDDKRLRLKGILKIVDDGLAKKLKNAKEQGVLRKDRVGLSIDTFPIYGQVQNEGRLVKVARGFEREKICSVDVVMRPAAGGGFDRLIAATQMEVRDMDMSKEELVALIRQLISEALAEVRPTEQAGGAEESPEAAAETVAAAAEEAAVEVAAEAPPDADPAQVAQVAADAAAAAAQEAADEVAGEEATKAVEAIQGRLREIETKLKLTQCAEMLERKIEAAQLTPQFAAIVREQFAGKVYEEKGLDVMIKSVKSAQAAVDPSGRVTEGGITRGEFLRPGMSGIDQAQVDLLRLMAGNSQLAALEHNEKDYVQQRVMESYRAWVNGGRPRTNTRKLSQWMYDLWGGDPMQDRAREAITTSTVSSLVKNAVNLLLAADYSKKTEWWDPIVSTEEVDTIDDATLVRVFGLDTLAVVAEGDPYVDQTWVDQEETATFHKRGNTVSITIETFLRDKLQKVRSLPERLSKSWWNTLSLLVSNVFTINSNVGPTLSGDGSSAALFNATAVSSTGGHANLLTAALSYTAYDAVYTAMMSQTDMVLGGGQKLADNTPMHLLIPVGLRAMAYQIRNTEHVPGSANYQRNPYGPDGDQPNVIVVPPWTDANDWACVSDPAKYPAIWLIFLRGRRVPELFTADNEVAGSMFTNDVMRFKVRLMTWRQSSSDNCAPVADWRPLHKNNV